LTRYPVQLAMYCSKRRKSLSILLGESLTGDL
jgi:hypothetical protein